MAPNSSARRPTSAMWSSGLAVALTKTPVERGLYEWGAGKLQLVSVLPASEGGGAVAGSLGNAVEEKEARPGTISSDGSRVIWAASGSALYMSDTATAETKTIRLDIPEPGCLTEAMWRRGG